MTSEPEIIKELREAEKFRRLQSKVQGAYEKLEVPEESPESDSDKTVGFADDYVKGNKGTDTVSGENTWAGSQNMVNKYRLIAENTSDLICLTTFTLNPIYTYVSPSYKKILGYEPDDLIGKPVFDFMHPYDKENLLPLLKKYIGMKAKKLSVKKSLDVTEKFENRVRDKSDGWHYMENTPNLMGDELLFVSKDVTEEKNAKEELNKYRMHFKELVDERISELQQELEEHKKLKEEHLLNNIVFESAIVSNSTADVNGVINNVNSAFLEMWGYKSKKNIIGKSIASFFKNQEDATPVIEALNKTGKWEGDFIAKRKDGSTFISKGHAVGIKNKNGEIIGYYSTNLDVTAEKQNEEELIKLREKSEVKYKIIFESLRDAIMTLAPPTWKFTSGNPATIKLFKAKDETEFISKGLWDVSPENQPDGTPSQEKAKKMIGKAMKEGSNFFEWTHKSLNDKEFSATVLLTRIEIEKDKPFLQATVRDITEQKKAEEELRLEKDRLQALIDGLNQTEIGVDIVGTDYKILSQNQFLKERFGECTGKLCYKEYMKQKNPCEFCTMNKAIKSGKVEKVELTNVGGRDYELLSAPLKDSDGTADRVIEVVRDITKQKKAEEKMNVKIDELEQYKKVTVGRELKMVELKNRIKELEDKLRGYEYTD